MFLQVAKESGKLTDAELEDVNQEDPNQIAQSDTTDFSDYLGHMFALQILGLMTTAHSEQTRYPFTDEMDYSVRCPVEIYTIDMPIIKRLSKLFKLADKAIEALKTEMQMHNH